jgi:hypothetical protein
MLRLPDFAIVLFWKSWIVKRYRTVPNASGLPALESWLALPVAGAALRVGFAEAGEPVE